jgi:hypothetical protein
MSFSTFSAAEAESRPGLRALQRRISSTVNARAADRAHFCLDRAASLGFARRLWGAAGA